MLNKYPGVITRFLREDERLILSQEKEMPLVIEASTTNDAAFLQQFLAKHSPHLLRDLAQYGAVLLRGFQIDSDQQFEKTILSVPEFNGIREAFMAENGRTHVDGLGYVLHTNSVYKTGGTLYLGGFHTENYYSTDVPGFLFFYCAQPSAMGGETGIINTQKIYDCLDESLQQKLEKKNFFVAKWMVSEVAARYQQPLETVEKIANHFNLPRVGSGNERFIQMFKPSVFVHPLTQKKALQINLFELPSLNKYLRAEFRGDYKGNHWFWHRFFWRLPYWLFQTIEYIAVAVIAFIHSPRGALKILYTRFSQWFAQRKSNLVDPERVGHCFTQQDVQSLAKTMRQHYSSFLWRSGDILLIDNKKVMHAGMPGKGNRRIRAMIANPIQMDYSSQEMGVIKALERTDCVGDWICSFEGKKPLEALNQHTEKA